MLGVSGELFRMNRVQRHLALRLAMNGLSEIAILFACACLAMSACSGRMDSDVRQAKAIMRMPENQRQQAFDKITPSKQLDVYLAGATKVEPPIMLQGYLAANWRAVLPVVKERLASETDARLAQLTPVLVIISDSYCSLADRVDVLSAVSAAIPRMAEYNQVAAEQDLRNISQPAKRLTPCM
jgi:hypothetical protein